MIRKFSFELDSWLRTSLEELPENLRAVKLDRKSIINNLITFRILKMLFNISGSTFLPHASETELPKWPIWSCPISSSRSTTLVKSALAVSFTHTNQQNDQPPNSKRKASSVNPETVEFLASR